MKELRTSAFDPKAKDRGLKSSMEGFPAIERPKQIPPAHPSPEAIIPVPPVPGVPLVPPVRDVPPSAPSKRKIKRRQPFDIYEDQDEALRKLSLEDRMRGGQGSMSAMVRAAIDYYIAKDRG